MSEITVVCCTVDPMKTLYLWSSFRKMAAEPFRLVLVIGGQGETLDGLPKELAEHIQENDAIVLRGIDGVVPAYLAGVKEAGSVEEAPKIIACFHDDLEILEEGWDERVKAVFEDPKVLLAGFGGGTGLGSADIYQSPYSPHQLARQDFVSNMKGGEAHGRISKQVERIACTDGFSIVGRGDFIYEAFTALNELNCVHHAYDSWIGAWCHKAGFEARMIPVFCDHKGGMTAVGSAAYQQWANTVREDGDQTFWEESHAAMYEDCRDVLPFSVKE